MPYNKEFYENEIKRKNKNIDYTYTVIITNKDNDLSATIKEESAEDDFLITGKENFKTKERKGKFLPLNVLHDIKRINKTDDDVYNHFLHKYESVFGIPIKTNSDSKYLIFMIDLKQAIIEAVKSDNRFTLDDLELVRQKYNLEYDYEILDNVKNQISYKYTCYTLSGIIYCLLHYLMKQGYKISVCKHCEQLFIADSYKTEFCKRNAPYMYTNQNCAFAKELILKELRRRKKVALNTLYRCNPSESNDFLNNCQDLVDIFKDEPTVLNTKKLEDYIEKTQKTQKAYLKKPDIKKIETHMEQMNKIKKGIKKPSHG